MSTVVAKMSYLPDTAFLYEGGPAGRPVVQLAAIVRGK